MLRTPAGLSAAAGRQCASADLDVGCILPARRLSVRTHARAPSGAAARARQGAVRVYAESPLVEDLDGVRGGALFNRTRWAYHQNSSRYVRHLQTIFKSTTFRNLQAPLSFITLNASMVVLYRYSVDVGTVKTPLSEVFDGVNFTDTAFQLTSFALSLLLVFRTDASYSRWCDAMGAWSTIRATSVDLVRKACSWVDDRAALDRLVRWLAAFSRSLMVVLRNDTYTVACKDAMRAELRTVLMPHEVDQVVEAGPYYPQFCLSVLTALVESTSVGEGREGAMLGDLQTFNNAVATCEKLLRFPIPLTYSRHTSRFMLIYLLALPLVLYDTCEWAAVPVTSTIAYLLLGIEDIGVQIEEPFVILPLPEICGDLQISMKRAVQQRSLVKCLADPDSCLVNLDGEDGTTTSGRVATQAEASALVAGARAAASRNGAGRSITGTSAARGSTVK